MKPLKVIFIGTGWFGVPSLEALVNSPDFKISFVITGQDKPSGRKLKLAFSPVKEASIANNLIVHQPKTLSEMKKNIAQDAPDFLLVASYGEIINKDILELPKVAAINIHGSLLPKYRGASPIQEALIQGEKETGSTWIVMNEKMDQGPMIAQQNSTIESDDNFESLYKKLAHSAGTMTPKVLMEFAQKKYSLPQDESNATYCTKISAKDGLIDLHKETAPSIVRKVNAYTPWPGCSIAWNKRRLKILKANSDEQKMYPGEVAVVNKKILLIGTKEGTLLPQVVQPESKPSMSISAFLQGQKELPKKI